MYVKRFQPFLVHLGLWIVFYISIFSIKIDLTLLLLFLLPITVADLWLAFTLVLMLRLPRRRSVSEIPHGWISEEQDVDGYPVRWLRTSIDDDKPLAILIHGWNSRAANMDGRAKIFIELGFNVLSFEMRAHGVIGKLIIGLPCISVMILKICCLFILPMVGSIMAS